MSKSNGRWWRQRGNARAIAGLDATVPSEPGWLIVIVGGVDCGESVIRACDEIACCDLPGVAPIQHTAWPASEGGRR